jgi:hypothetical protein
MGLPLALSLVVVDNPEKVEASLETQIRPMETGDT